MRRSILCLAAAFLALSTPSVEACCRRAARRCGHHPVSYARPVAPVPMAYAAAPAPIAYSTAQPVVAPTPTVIAGVQPAYRYEAGEGRSAYYYTYDSSGKLIIQQWMDWVFRGGKEAGMPRPPLPIIGYFTGPR